jgi:hypothetical protein
MLKGKIASFALVAGMLLVVLQSAAQQDEGPILHPKKPISKPAGATLLVICDLTCDWKLDTVSMGRIEAGASAKAKVELGQHLVVAAAENGLDQFHQIVKVEDKGQTVLVVELRPIREVRIRSEQAAREIAAQEARNRAAQQVLDRLVWTDPATRLTWAKEDNGSDVNWQEALDYCRYLQLGGYSDWRLPTINELQGIYDQSSNVAGLLSGPAGTWHVKGKIQLSGWEWSSSAGKDYGRAWFFFFGGGRRDSVPVSNSFQNRALCVRRSGE